MLCIDPEQRITINEALKHPFLSDLHDPTDEPTCDFPFQIEHEIDNLPVKILKRKILRNSCMTSYEKKSYHSSEENLFKDFDETFPSCYCPADQVTHRSSSSKDSKNTRNSAVTKFNSHGEETWSSNTNSSIESPPATYSRKYDDLLNTCNDNESFIPSLKDAMGHCEVLIDEPFRDPGVCARKYHNDFSVTPVKSNFLSSEPSDTSYFSGLSPVIDMSEPCYSIKSECKKSSDINNNREAPFLGDHGRSCAINIQESKKSQKEMGVKKEVEINSTPKILPEKECFDDSTIYTNTNLKSMSELRSLNCEILRTLNERHCASQCNFQALITDNLTKSRKQFSHWDSLKLWV